MHGAHFKSLFLQLLLTCIDMILANTNTRPANYRAGLFFWFFCCLFLLNTHHEEPSPSFTAPSIVHSYNLTFLGLINREKKNFGTL